MLTYFFLPVLTAGIALPVRYNLMLVSFKLIKLVFQLNLFLVEDDFKPFHFNTGNASAPPPPSYTEATYEGPSTGHGTHTRTGRPGFWTGMGVGGLAGYLFGSR